MQASIRNVTVRPCRTILPASLCCAAWFAQPSLAVGVGEAVDDVGKRGEVDAAAGTNGFDAECHCKMALVGTGLADEVVHLVAIDKVELGE